MYHVGVVQWVCFSVGSEYRFVWRLQNKRALSTILHGGVLIGHCVSFVASPGGGSGFEALLGLPTFRGMHGGSFHWAWYGIFGMIVLSSLGQQGQPIF